MIYIGNIEENNPILKDYNELINNFKIESPIGNNVGFYNQYNTQYTFLNDNLKNFIISTINNHIISSNLYIEYTRINLVEKNTNLNDMYHTDIGNDIIFTFYPKQSFTGGEFEWIENEIVHSIKPEENMYIILVNNNPHRVLNVTSGKRFAIVTFCNTFLKEQTIKNLI